MNIYLSEYIAPSARRRIEAKCAIVDTFDHPEQLDGIIVRRAEVTGDILRRASKLRVVSMHGVGLDHIDVNTAKQLGIPVTNVPGQSAQSVAELAVSMMLALSRKLKYINSCVEAGKLTSFGETQTIGHEIWGKRIALVGSGHIAQRVATIMRLAFGCTILCYNPHKSARELADLGMTKIDTLDDLFAAADVVSVHVPLNHETEGMIGQRALAHAKPGLLLVNTARGGIVDEQALYHALCQGRIAGAACDVFTDGIPDPETPLLHLPNFISTLHIGGSTEEALERVGNKAVDNLFAGLAGRLTDADCVWGSAE